MENKITRTYEITGVSKDNESFVVKANFIENEKVVGHICHSLRIKLSDEEKEKDTGKIIEEKIEREIKKVCRTFFTDKDNAIVERIRMKKDEKDNKIIKNLTGKKSKI